MASVEQRYALRLRRPAAVPTLQWSDRVLQGDSGPRWERFVLEARPRARFGLIRPDHKSRLRTALPSGNAQQPIAETVDERAGRASPRWHRIVQLRNQPSPEQWARRPDRPGEQR